MDKKVICICGLIMLMGAAIIYGQGCASDPAASADGTADTAGTESDLKESSDTGTAGEDEPTDTETGSDSAEETVNRPGLADETATDGLIDFDVLQSENPDIYAWLYIPDTDIDYPVLRAGKSDDYYKTRGADGQANNDGCVYTEMYNSMDMSDFNTVIHGSDADEDSVFHDLHKYEDPEYFDAHRAMYIVLPYTTITYEIIGAYYDDGSDILRRYDYTTVTGCTGWITEYENRKELSMNKAEPSIPLSVGNSFIVTLNGLTDPESNRQYVVIASLTDSGTAEMTRYISDEEDGFYESMESDE